MSVSIRIVLAALFLSWLGVSMVQAQAPVEQVPVEKGAPPPADNKTKPPRSDAGLDESSSKGRRKLMSRAPAGDLNDHPGARARCREPFGVNSRPGTHTRR